MSDFLKVNTQDWLKGLIMTVITAALTLIYQLLLNGAQIDWKQVGVVAATAGVGYLLKQLGTDTEGKFFGKI